MKTPKYKIPFGWKLRADGWKDIGDKFLNKPGQWLNVEVAGKNYGNIVVITKEVL